MNGSPFPSSFLWHFRVDDVPCSVAQRSFEQSSSSSAQTSDVTAGNGFVKQAKIFQGGDDGDCNDNSDYGLNDVKVCSP
jgi:hypothetical protein